MHKFSPEQLELLSTLTMSQLHHIISSTVDTWKKDTETLTKFNKLMTYQNFLDVTRKCIPTINYMIKVSTCIEIVEKYPNRTFYALAAVHSELYEPIQIYTEAEFTKNRDISILNKYIEYADLMPKHIPTFSRVFCDGVKYGFINTAYGLSNYNKNAIKNLVIYDFEQIIQYDQMMLLINSMKK